MNRFVAGAVLALLSTQAQAAGLDRSGQSTNAIFAADGTASLSFGYVMPSVTGKDALGNKYDVGEAYSQTSLSYTNALEGTPFNYALIFDQPYGANVDYGGDPTTTALGGTSADLSSKALTFIGRYKFGERFSVFGGVGVERIEADVDLNGLAYAAPFATRAVASTVPGLDPQVLGAALQGDPAAASNIDTTYGAGTTARLGAGVRAQTGRFAGGGGYKFRMDQTTKPTYLIGAAYEIPDIALRIAGTYRFETDHSADTVEYDIFRGTTRSSVDFVSPQSFNLDFQTGIMEGTLLTASYRWTDFSAVDITPTALGRDLVDSEDGHRYTLGVARRFSDAFAGSLTLSYEPEQDRGVISPLGPTDGLFGVSLGGQYSRDNMKFSGGVNYSWVGNTEVGTNGIEAARFEDNHVVGIGFKAEMTF
jgi:long-subunit fatty acid transport protein